MYILSQNKLLFFTFRFVGEMDRQVSSAKLQHRPNGTYLIRVRPQSENKERYALSLK